MKTLQTEKYTGKQMYIHTSIPTPKDKEGGREMYEENKKQSAKKVKGKEKKERNEYMLIGLLLPCVVITPF